MLRTRGGAAFRSASPLHPAPLAADRKGAGAGGAPRRGTDAETPLIWLTKLDGSQILVNDEQITYVELAGETVVSLANGDRLRVLESPDELTSRIVRWRRRVSGGDVVALPGLEQGVP